MKIKEWLGIITVVVVLAFLLPLLGKILFYVLGLGALFFLVMYLLSGKTRREIEIDPLAYFARQKQEREKELVERKDVIDAQFTEREIDND